ncbi:hypothetical protein LINPERPRIM_LOCUS5399 [Linum perenne]
MTRALFGFMCVASLYICGRRSYLSR